MYSMSCLTLSLNNKSQVLLVNNRTRKMKGVPKKPKTTMNHMVHIQSTGQKSLCVNKFSLHHKAMFLLNSRIPLVRFSSESIVAGVRHLPFPGSPIQILPCDKFLLSSSFNVRHYNPILRSNPFPEVTNLICRIPLSTLFYRP